MPEKHFQMRSQNSRFRKYLCDIIASYCRMIRLFAGIEEKTAVMLWKYAEKNGPIYMLRWYFMNKKLLPQKAGAFIAICFENQLPES